MLIQALHSNPFRWWSRIRGWWRGSSQARTKGWVFPISFVRSLMTKLAVPIIVVFTQFDMLVSRHEQSMTDEELELPDDEIDPLILKRAEDDFQASCVDLLDKVGHNLPYAKVSGSIHGLPSSVHTSSNTTFLCSATSTPTNTFEPGQHHPRPCCPTRRRWCMDCFGNGTEGQCSSENKFIYRVS